MAIAMHHDDAEELRREILFHEIIDVPLFFLGLVVPLFAGDLIESLIGNILDIVLLTRLHRIVGGKAWAPFLLEIIDLTDFLSGGILDILGWLELVPFWLLFFDLWVRNGTILVEPSVPAPVACLGCGNSLESGMQYCEKCGQEQPADHRDSKGAT